MQQQLLMVALLRAVLFLPEAFMTSLVPDVERPKCGSTRSGYSNKWP